MVGASVQCTAGRLVPIAKEKGSKAEVSIRLEAMPAMRDTKRDTTQRW